MRKRAMIALCTVAICIAAFLLVPQFALAVDIGKRVSRTITVTPDGGKASTIQRAVQEALPGDTILVKPGRYLERVVLDKPVVLKGEGAPVIDGGGSGDVLTIIADNTTVEGLVITNGGHDLSKDESGLKIKSNHNTISNNKILSNSFGVYLYAANDNIVSHNVVRGREEVGQSKRGNGIHLWNSQGNVIDSNQLTANRDALYFSLADHNRITNNLAHGQRYGIHYMYSNHNMLEGNVLRNNVGGVAMMYSHNNLLKGNQVYQNDKDGVVLRDMDDNTLAGNTIYNNPQGLFMYNCNRNRVDNNLLAANMTGLNLTAGSADNIFTGNSWVQNVMQVKLQDPLNNRWDDGKKGNYWSNYNGYDIDGNGIGDTAYWQSVLTELLATKYPLVKLLFNSPLLQAVQLAEKAFPVLRPPGVVDRHPLMQISQKLAKNINWHMEFTLSPSEDDTPDHSQHMLMEADEQMQGENMEGMNHGE